MSSFDNAQVTLKGSVLLAKALNGEKLVFTKVVMGDGEYTGEISAVESLVNLRKVLPITKITRKENIAIIGSILASGDIDEEFSWTELGIYAKGEDDVEVLYMYGNAGDKASYISKLGLDEKLIDINIVVGNASNVTALIDSSLVFLTESALTEHEEDENAHSKLKVWVQNLFATGDWAKYDQVGESTDDETKGTVFGAISSVKNIIVAFKNAFDTFRTAYTDVRGAKLDNLDAKMTSRAPADTALSNATWTDTRAGLIDTINTSTKTNNTASKTGTLSQKTSYLIDTLIGATNATGGTTTAGTVMAKLNAIVNFINTPQGDYCGKTMQAIPSSLYLDIAKDNSATYTYTNSKGGLAEFVLYISSGTNSEFTLIVDGTTVLEKGSVYALQINDVLRVPFKTEIKMTIKNIGTALLDFKIDHGVAYLNP